MWLAFIVGMLLAALSASGKRLRDIDRWEREHPPKAESLQ